MATAVHWIETPKNAVRQRPPALNPEQRAALGATFNRAPRAWRQARNRAIALLVLSEGMRPAEVAALRIEQARAWRRTGADGSMTRRTRLARQAVGEWLARRAYECIPGEQAFPRDVRGAACSANDVYRLVHQLLRHAGVDPRQLGRLNVGDCVRRTPVAGPRRARALPRTPGDRAPRL